MKFEVLAVDYDGTIAQDGVLHPDVKAAIIEARKRGVVAVLVTGRILSDLRQAAGDLEFVDAVVAENGAVLAFPDGQSRLIGRPPSQNFLDELHRRGIVFKKGECVVDTDAASAPQILELIRELKLPLVLLFNRSRLMVLPQAISKGTGLREALKILRLSVHNAIAIGDAENDHDFLASCEIAVAVAWGSAALQNEADVIVRGDGPHAVASYIRQVVKEMRLPRGRADRHRVIMGTSEDGSQLSFRVDGRNVLVVGDSQSGKSWVTGLSCEQMILQGYCVCVIDPEGDYSKLDSLPGVLILGGNHSLPELPHVAHALQHFDLSVVVDLSHAPYEEKVSYLKVLLPMLAALRRATGLPHRIVVDEAHYFLSEPNVKQLLDLELDAYTIVTYRPSELHPDLRKDIDLVIVKHLTDRHEVATLLTMVGNRDFEGEWTVALKSLAIDEAAALPRIDEPEGKLLRFRLAHRLTTHVRHRVKYFDVQLARGQEFVFTDKGKTIGQPAQSLQQFVSLLGGIPVASLEGHVHRGDFSRWIAGVFHDHRLASDVRKLEQRYRLGHLDDVRPSVARLIQERYGFSHDKDLVSTNDRANHR